MPCGVVDELGEDERCARVMGREERERDGNDDHADDVPPDTHVREQRDDGDAERVEQAVDYQDAGVDDEHPALRGRVVRDHVQEEREEGCKAEVDASGDCHLAEEVEPPGEPAPCARLVLSELRRPVVQTTGSRVGRGDLRHPETDDRCRESDDDPTPDEVDRASVAHTEIEERQAARQYRDDRERDGEVRESAHTSAELLGVSECMELCGVVVDGVTAAGARTTDP